MVAHSRQIAELCFHGAEQKHFYVSILKVRGLDILPLPAKRHQVLPIPRRIPCGNLPVNGEMEFLTFIGQH